MGRPTGVTILAILNFIGAGFCLLGGIGLLLSGGVAATMLNQQGGNAGAASFFAALGALSQHYLDRNQRCSESAGTVRFLDPFQPWRLDLDSILARH